MNPVRNKSHCFVIKILDNVIIFIYIKDMNAREVKKKLEKAGFTLARINGSHWIYEKKGFPPIPVPDHGSKDIKPGTLNSILKAAGLK